MVKDGRCKRIGRRRGPKVGMIADVWGLLKQVIGVSSRETELDAFVISVKYIDHFWLEPLQIAGEHLHRQRRLFSEVNKRFSTGTMLMTPRQTGVTRLHPKSQLTACASQTRFCLNSERVMQTLLWVQRVNCLN